MKLTTKDYIEYCGTNTIGGLDGLNTAYKHDIIRSIGLDSTTVYDMSYNVSSVLLEVVQSNIWRDRDSIKTTQHKPDSKTMSLIHLYFSKLAYLKAEKELKRRRELEDFQEMHKIILEELCPPNSLDFIQEGS